MSTVYDITVPSDLGRLEKLGTKLVEYRERIEGVYPEDGPDHDPPRLRHPHDLMSEAVLSRLLDRGGISRDELYQELKEEYGDEFDGYHFSTAFGVIADYTETGGVNASGGTGLG